MTLQTVKLGDVCRAAMEGQQDLTVAQRAAQKGPYAYYADNCQSYGIDDWLVEAGGAVIVPAYGQVVASTGYVMARKEQGRFSFGKQVHALVPHDRADTDYLFQVVTHSPQIAHQVSGTPQLRQLSRGSLLASRIPWPCRATRDAFVAMVEGDDEQFRRLEALPGELMREGDERFAAIVGEDAEQVALSELVSWRQGTAVPAEARGRDKAVRVEGSRCTLGRCDEALAEGPSVLVAPQGRATVARFVPEACHPLADVRFACAVDAKVDLGVLLFALRAAGVREGTPREAWVGAEAFERLEVRVGTQAQQERFAEVARDLLARLAQAQADLEQLGRDHMARLTEFFTHGSVWGNGTCEGCDEALGEVPAAPQAPATAGAAQSAGPDLAELGPLEPLARQGLGILSDAADVAWELAPLAVVRACASPAQWAFIAAAAGPYAAPAYASLVRALDTVMGELAGSDDLLSFLPNLSYASSLLTLEQLAAWVGALDAIEPGKIDGARVRAALRLDPAFAQLPAAVQGLWEAGVLACAHPAGGRAAQTAYVPCGSEDGVCDLFARELPEVTLRTQTGEFARVLADMLVRAAQLAGARDTRGGMGASGNVALAQDDFPDWRADLVCGVLPSDEGAWHQGTVERDDPRWAVLGVPPRNKATFAWVQQALYHLAPGGACVLLVPNCALHSQVGSELELRGRLAESGRVRAVVSLPSRLFADGRPAQSLLVLGEPDPAGRTLMVSLLGEGVPSGTPGVRELPDEALQRATGVLKVWLERGEEACEQGFCRVVGLDEIAAAANVLMPWTYVG